MPAPPKKKLGRPPKKSKVSSDSKSPSKIVNENDPQMVSTTSNINI